MHAVHGTCVFCIIQSKRTKEANKHIRQISNDLLYRKQHKHVHISALPASGGSEIFKQRKKEKLVIYLKLNI